MNGILFYAPTIFQGLGLSGTTVSLLATGVVGAVMLIATLPTVLFLDREFAHLIIPLTSRSRSC
jgi:hypothetical protein